MAWQFGALVALCIQYDPEFRPKMSEVVASLTDILQLSEV